MSDTPEPLSSTSVKRSTEKSRPSIFWLLAALILPIARVMMKITIIDGHKLPRSGPFILAPNHFSEIDPIVIGIATWKMGRVPRFMAKASLFRIPVVGWLLRSSGQIPVEREGSARGKGPIEAAGDLVTIGGGVIVYPEGTLTRDPQMWPMRGKTGAARMALTHDLPVIPVAHWGTQKVMARYGKKVSFFPPKKITIKVGDVVDLSACADRPRDSATFAEATNTIMNAITAELEMIRHEDAPDERWDPTKHNQKETGRFES
ncbi:lysophospholipid acyltransferase family protein [Paramicrobacterium agarici]|uniref:1-acyl-sn-glycerol-3-phosphate acyltransferase n=1 Tax=Paramicrobacterium agarici TaxID=630514 RepID=A0A2A9E009_9MICO|nr:lysophospholipid acyltransferase family protein [Microbacterium agarici]PFG31552.1 1-acyl-sn-glycerol-3-phosphate acyltransferase [Microbacterium agarici]TQO21438.1 1-acyl-sn-glycerol-3-phosphate acyltransferase [Microbacterium agarici]